MRTGCPFREDALALQFEGLELAFAFGLLEVSIGGATFLGRVADAGCSAASSLLLFDGFALPSSRHDVILPCRECGRLKFCVGNVWRNVDGCSPYNE